jgi:hypothetical protein
MFDPPVCGNRNLRTIDFHRIPCRHADGATPVFFLKALSAREPNDPIV